MLFPCSICQGCFTAYGYFYTDFFLDDTSCMGTGKYSKWDSTFFVKAESDLLSGGRISGFDDGSSLVLGKAAAYAVLLAVCGSTDSGGSLGLSTAEPVLCRSAVTSVPSGQKKVGRKRICVQ